MKSIVEESNRNKTILIVYLYMLLLVNIYTVCHNFEHPLPRTKTNIIFVIFSIFQKNKMGIN